MASRENKPGWVRLFAEEKRWRLVGQVKRRRRLFRPYQEVRIVRAGVRFWTGSKVTAKQTTRPLAADPIVIGEEIKLEFALLKQGFDLQKEAGLRCLRRTHFSCLFASVRMTVSTPCFIPVLARKRSEAGSARGLLPVLDKAANQTDA